MKKHLLMAVFAMTAICANAQESNLFNIDVQLRTRAEYNNGAINPRAEHELPANFTNNRSRLSMGWKRSNLELRASVQHVGVWGQDGIKEQNGRVAMNEAWGKIEFGDFEDRHFIKIGRQQLSYDDERILGGLDWNVAGNWHDAILYGWESNEMSYRDKLHVALAYNQNRENVRGDVYSPSVMPYKQLYMAWYHIDFVRTPLGISLMALNVGRETATAGARKSETKQMQLIGGDINFRPGSWNIHGAFYYESGKNTADQNVNAWMASAKVGYNINNKWNVSAGYDFLSGEDYDNAGSGPGGISVNTADASKTHAFTPLFGTHHKFYGSMDYFYASDFKNGLAPGLQDIQAGINFKASQKVNLNLNYHYYLTASDILVTDGKGLGHEIDLQVTAKLQKDVTLMAGYSTMLGTETMDVVKGGNHKSWQDWGWVQLNINPRVLFTKW